MTDDQIAAIAERVDAIARDKAEGRLWEWSKGMIDLMETLPAALAAATQEIERLKAERQAAERQRDALRGVLKNMDAWLDERRNAPTFTTLGMVQDYIRRATEQL